MATEERDSTADWIVPAERRPPSAFELQRRIEVATGIARAAEEAAIEIGQASLEAAESARLAATHAERSAAASLAAARAASAREVQVDRLAEAGPADAAPGLDSPPPATPEEDSGREALGPAPAPGHEAIPGSELPVAWSPVARPEANGSDPLPAAARPARPSAQPDPFDERMIAFRERAERVMARLVRLEAAPPVS